MWYDIKNQKGLMMIELNKIFAAKTKVYDVAIKTPLTYSSELSGVYQNKVYLKSENLQTIGAYKIRGAYNKLCSLSKEQLSHGVIAASAGNHAQGVAMGAAKFGCKAVIVMPESTPLLKVSSTKKLGAEVILKGDNFDEANAYANEYAKEHKLTYIHPFADEYVMAGQGTIMLEMLDEINSLDSIVVPVGGGGLICGIASAAKQINPDIKIIAVQASGANAMYNSYQNGKIINSKSVKTIADGIAVRDAHEYSFKIIQECVDEFVLVDEEEIAAAVLFLLEKHKMVVEGAGAASVAALMHKKIKNIGKNTACILSGGNIDVGMLNTIIEKGLFKTHRKMKLSFTLVDKPGALMHLTNVLQDVKANIVKIDYDRFSTEIEYGDAVISIAIETKGLDHQEEIKKALKQHGYDFVINK